ncbi:Small-conductance mechanosensitive channel [Jannaschia faecimaris]|uniref:Small-conductance mechanosensitive channel n=1 Tax=Jannaschia faecimaris TaxID=1244108 RepID=A0A1H3S4R1_9RHOB|nr:DUF3772 domain-containing protein [Jannaschia faecimaris]SDZ32777.1 Small-conductance mechanosensitive channel [Jannaschia faecimaris]
MIRFLASLLVCVLCALPAAAQGPDAAPDDRIVFRQDGTLEISDDWGKLSSRAEDAIASGQASIGALEQLLAELVSWRNVFDEASDIDSARIATLRAQIEALGPVPAEGATEPADIAARRDQLNDRLETLMAPGRVAQAAFTEAEGLISAVDRLIQADRAREVLRKGPIPLNPANWPVAFGAIGGWIGGFAVDLYAPFSTPTDRAVWQARGLELGALAFAAILLLWRSGVWLARLRDRIARDEAESAVVRVTLLLISLARLILPLLGLVALTRMLQLMGASGVRIEAATTLLPLMGLIILLARWLALQALPKRETAQAFLPVASARRAEARWHALTLGLLLAGAFAVEVITPTLAEPEVSRAIAHFVLLIIAGVNLVRLGQLFLSEGIASKGDEGDGLWGQVLRLLGRALMVVGVCSPLIATFGYVNLGGAIIWPSVLSLALIMLIGILQGLVFDIYAAITRRPDAGGDALTPTLVGLALALGSLPVLALIWGVRPSTLAEWWTRFMRGFTIGGTDISPSNFVTFALVFMIGLLAVRLLKGVLRTNILPKTKMDSGGTNAVLSGTGYIGITLAALIAITAAGIDLSGLAIVAGALSLGIGFGLQTIVQNFVSGIILLVERPIKLGDWVNVGGVEGFVRQISVRSTRIETFDRQDVIVPNADLISGVVTNYTLSNSSGRVVLTVGVAYGSDTRRVEKILQEVAQTHPMVILQPPPLVTFDGFGADSLNFTVRVVLRDILFKPIVTSELNHAIAERFHEEGLEIPFAQRDIWLRNPETLRDGRPADTAPTPTPEAP